MGNRKFHIAFGWCEVTNNKNHKGHVQIKLEADAVELYEIGYGYKKYKKHGDKSPIVFYVNPTHLKEDESCELSRNELLFKRALNCTLTIGGENHKAGTIIVEYSRMSGKSAASKRLREDLGDFAKVMCACGEKMISYNERKSFKGSCQECAENDIPIFECDSCGTDIPESEYIMFNCSCEECSMN